MTDEQINQRIAEACGWKPHDHPKCMAKKEGWSMPERWIMRPDGTLAFRHDIPNYCGDLNAMHEAEKVLQSSNGAWETYGNKLVCMFGCDAFAAPPRQRAEAFLRTIGKWEEAQK